MKINNKLRNVAIIAHVDHGKTTLVNAMLKQCGAFRQNQQVDDRIMDNNDLEKERGITILAKNTSVHYKDTKINVVDTPGHADFGGEVERILKMIDGVLLLVDAFEGPMPQTRFVLQKALSLNLSIIIVINKVDKPNARVSEVESEILDLLIDLGAGEEALDYPIVYCSGRDGLASLSRNHLEEDLSPLFETILEKIPAPAGHSELPLQVLVSSIDYNEYVGRIGIGKIQQGKMKVNQEVNVCDASSSFIPYKSKIANLYQIENLSRVSCEEAVAGDIVCFSGIENITIGNTVCDSQLNEPIPFVNVSEPTLQMAFMVNNSPFAGREGKYVTSRNLRDRLYKELLKDVSLRVTDGETKDTFIVSGRGEIHISILIENMRREGFEFQVGKPKVLFKVEDGKMLEPIERVSIDVPQEYLGKILETLGSRKGELQQMNPVGNRYNVEFLIPTRGLLGYKTEFLNETHGEGIMNTLFDSYQPFKGDIPKRPTGSLIAHEAGEATSYGIFNAQDRGTMFVKPQDNVYQGMVVGFTPKNVDIVVNVCKKKQMTNMRAAGSDEALRLNSPKNLSLEESIEFIEDNELLEITPKSIRIRKKILDPTLRMRDDIRTGVLKKK